MTRELQILNRGHSTVAIKDLKRKVDSFLEDEDMKCTRELNKGGCKEIGIPSIFICVQSSKPKEAS